MICCPPNKRQSISLVLACDYTRYLDNSLQTEPQSFGTGLYDVDKSTSNLDIFSFVDLRAYGESDPRKLILL
jgi:hypothetical protein